MRDGRSDRSSRQTDKRRIALATDKCLGERREADRMILESLLGVNYWYHDRSEAVED